MALPRCIDPEKIIPISRLSTEVFKTGTWGTRAPVHGESLSPCRGACPAGEDIPAYVALAKEGDLEAAFQVLTRENPLPAVCGRVCYHPCESACLREGWDGSVSIHRIERYIGDYGISRSALSGPEKDSGFSVAVVGSGPAGLSCACHSRRLGHQVTLFEAETELGGLLRLGIPAYRLPREILDRSIRMILDTGIQTRTGFRLGKKGTWKVLDSFDAVFLAPGAHDPLMPQIRGMEHGEVMSGLGFLKDVNLGRRKGIDGPVAIMGGGNTAIDAARVCLRLGAEATVLYRRSEKEMPASAEEIADALAEGVKLSVCTLPVAIRTLGMGLEITCVKTKAEGEDESGRSRYSPVKGSEFEMEFKTLILGTGQRVSILEEAGPISVSPEGIQVDSFLHAGEGKYYAGGDAVPVPRRVCDAIGSGKLAAMAMHARLNGVDPESLWELVRIGRGNAFSMAQYLEGSSAVDPRISRPIRTEDVKPEWFEPCERVAPARLDPAKAIRGFEEVVPDVLEEEIAHASSRCFSCGTCTGCDRCYLFCPEISVIPAAREETRYRGNSEFCKGCGVCASVCPRGVMTMKEGK